MNRTIKFRGKCIGGGWVYGFFAQVNGKSYIIDTNYATSEHSVHWREVDPDTVGQYVDQDSFKNEAYEGDFVSNNYGTDKQVIRKIEFSEGGFEIVRVSGKSSLLDRLPAVSWLKMNMKVIGNIHDNPEMVKA